MGDVELTRRRIDETAKKGKRLGRHVLHDPRSRNFEAEAARAIKDVLHPSVGLPLDQGDIGSCTANALCGALNTKPVYLGGRAFTEQDARALYGLETRMEGEPWPPNDPGGTGLMVCRAAHSLGWIGVYRHAFGLQHALLALVLRAQIWGLNWYEGFDSPDGDGIVRISGSVRGGHEILATGIDTKRELVRFENSWGSAYGVGGVFWMPFADADRVLQEQGDVTVPYPVPAD